MSRDQDIKRFRKMSWLEVNTLPRKPLSPEKAMILIKAKPKGVKTFRSEKHSRFSSVGTFRPKKITEQLECGLSHEELQNALELPNRKAVSTKSEARLGGVRERFTGKDTHFIKGEGAEILLSQEEVQQAIDLPNRKATTQKTDVGLGGIRERFEGKESHFIKTEGADMMLPQPENKPPPMPLTISKSNWLKNLWTVAGTALEDREMRQCDAIMTPNFPVHKDLTVTGIVANMNATTGARFTYQKLNPTSSLGTFLSSVDDKNLKPKVVVWKTEKHSRFSTYGSVYNKKI